MCNIRNGSMFLYSVVLTNSSDIILYIKLNTTEIIHSQRLFKIKMVQNGMKCDLIGTTLSYMNPSDLYISFFASATARSKGKPSKKKDAYTSAADISL